MAESPAKRGLAKVQLPHALFPAKKVRCRSLDTLFAPGGPTAQRGPVEIVLSFPLSNSAWFEKVSAPFQRLVSVDSPVLGGRRIGSGK